MPDDPKLIEDARIIAPAFKDRGEQRATPVFFTKTGATGSCDAIGHACNLERLSEYREATWDEGAQAAARKMLETVCGALGIPLDRIRETDGSIDSFVGILRAYRDQCRTEGRAEMKRDLLAMCEPWPLRDVLSKLADAADHLLSDHDCDAHGWEEVGAARNSAREFVRRLESGEPDVAGEGRDGE